MWLENNPYPSDGRVRKEAESLAASGYDVEVVCPRAGDQPRREAIKGVSVHRYRLPRTRTGAFGYVVEYAVALVKTAAISLGIRIRRRFDVIHAHNPPDLFFLPAAPFKLLGTRFVFDHHDLSPEMYRARFGADASSIVERALRIAEGLTLRIADHVISTNETYRLRALERGVDRNDVTVVRNGPDLSVVRPLPPDPRVRSRAATIIGYVGEIGPQDGVDHLLRALAHLKDDLGHDDFYCVIIGDGDALPGLRDLSSHLGLNRHVGFEGRIDDVNRVMTLLSSAHICVDPDPSNPYNDASSMIKLTEYMALGKPTVAFDLPEHRVTCGPAAVYAAPNDDSGFARAILDLIRDADRQAAMAVEARRRAESDFNWAVQAGLLIDSYRRILGAHGVEEVRRS